MAEISADRDSENESSSETGSADSAVADSAAADSAAADSAEPDEGPVSASAKDVFAAALEKKKAAGQARSAHLDGHGGVGGATASHKATRTFRRKSG